MVTYLLSCISGAKVLTKALVASWVACRSTKPAKFALVQGLNAELRRESGTENQIRLGRYQYL